VKQQIVRVGAHSVGKIFGILYFTVMMTCAPLMLLTFALPNANGRPPFQWWILLLPVAYGVIAYVFFGLAALLYNLIARLVGGIELTTSADAEAVTRS
jgi:hypothetical protein